MKLPCFFPSYYLLKKDRHPGGMIPKKQGVISPKIILNKL